MIIQDNPLLNTTNNPYNLNSTPKQVSAQESATPPNTKKSEASTDGEESKEARETYKSTLLELMDEESYNSFIRATQGVDDSTKIRYANSLEIFTANYINATQGVQDNFSLLDSDELSYSSIIGQHTMLQVSSYSLGEGSDILSKMSTGSGESMQQFMERFKNALLSGQGIDVDG